MKKNYDGARDLHRESVADVYAALVMSSFKKKYLSALQIRSKIKQAYGYFYETCTIKKAIGILKYHGCKIEKIRVRVPRRKDTTFVKYRLA